LKKRKFIAIFEGLILLFLLPLSIGNLSAQSQNGNISYIGSTLWCKPRETTVRGNYEYCVFPHGLLIVDVSDPTSPQYVSKCYIPGNGKAIFVSGGYAYIAND